MDKDLLVERNEQNQHTLKKEEHKEMLGANKEG